MSFVTWCAVQPLSGRAGPSESGCCDAQSPGMWFWTAVLVASARDIGAAGELGTFVASETHLVVSGKRAGVPVAVGILDAICTSSVRRTGASADCMAVGAEMHAAHLPHNSRCRTCMCIMQCQSDRQRTSAATSAAVGMLAANTSGGLK